MFHVAGLNCSLVLAPLSGQTIVYPPPGKWQEAVQLALTEKYRGTVWSLVPTQLWRLLEWPTLKDYDLTSLRTVGGGSAVWPPELLRKLEETLPWVRPGPRPRVRHDRDQRAGDVVEPGGHLHPTRLHRPGGAHRAGRDTRPRDP